MPNESETFATGVPVEIGKIERELKKLWEQGGASMTRASLMNLAVYSEAPDALATNTQLIAKITEDHACRALVISALPDAGESRAEAWISAHCHISRAGAKQVCSEQISFLLRGRASASLPNIVFSHLDSDLPFFLWWQGDLHDPMDPQLWAWVDRLIFDTQAWSDPPAQYRLLQNARAESKQRLILRDLNWTRTLHFRFGLAQFFDSPTARQHLREIERVEITFAPGFRSTALLLGGWLGAQLRWTLRPTGKSTAVTFHDEANGREISFLLAEAPGQPVGSCRVQGARAEFRVAHAPGSDLLETSTAGDGEERTQQMIPAGENDPVKLLGEELTRGSRHRIYLNALELVQPLL